VVLAGVEDPQAATPVAFGVGALLLVPLGVATWDVDLAEAWPWMAASAAFQIVFLSLLARAYARADLGFVYPIARGTGPVLVLVAGAVLFSQRPGPVAVAGVLLVVAGIVLVRGVSDPPGRGDLALALGVGACIAGHTVVDDQGLDHAAALPYFACVLVPTAGGALALRRPRGLARPTPRIAAVGAGMVLAYSLTLAALEQADAAPVAAVRETSVLFAVAVAAALGRERLTPARAAGALAVVAGVAALSLG
jgi:drug/metabolite transporter (DMT)-like permease